jgi:hypothetical protein
VSEEILINVTPQETRVAVVENGVLQGEAGMSRMHLTCIRAAERPAMDGRAGDNRNPWRRARDGMHPSSLCGGSELSAA